jgi:hypothetical protein
MAMVAFGRGYVKKKNREGSGVTLPLSRKIPVTMEATIED